MTHTLPVEFVPDAILAACIDRASNYTIETESFNRKALIRVAQNCNFSHVRFDANGNYFFCTPGVN